MTDSKHLRVDVRLKRAIESGTLPKELVICGPAGTGKTYSLWRCFHALCCEHKLRVLLLRATRVSLTESVLVTYEKILDESGWGFLKEGAGRANRRSYDYPNGSTVVVAGLDRNPTRVLSTDWDVVSYNEVIEGNLESWETLGSRMDRPGYQGLGWLVGDTNPGAPDHWIKRRCDAGLATLWDTSHKANPTLWDANGWTEAGLKYLARLNNLTGPRRKRLLDGLWVQGEGLWFDTFDPAAHVTEAAEYDPKLKTVLAIDTGVWTGAVWFQVHEGVAGATVRVFQDLLTEGVPAFNVATQLIDLTGKRKLDRVVHDPAGRTREATGSSVIAEYERAGLKRLESWPVASVRDGLELIQAFVGGTAEGPPPALFVHPRCTAVINAFAGYKRAKRQNQWMDFPEDPQHPYEDAMDALRGGLVALYPDGRRPAYTGPRIAHSRIF